MTITADLFALQELDTAIDSCDRELDQIRAQYGDSETAADIRAEIAELEVKLRAAQHRAREIEDDIADQRAKVAPAERKLYDGSVTVAKELQSLHDDVTMLKRRQSELEDRELEVMEEQEGLAATLAAARGRLAELETSWHADQEHLHERERELLAERQRLIGLREQRAARIDARALAQYEHLRPVKRGRAVARIERGVCTGCRISLPITTQQRARSGMQIVQCTSCERILYAG